MLSLTGLIILLIWILVVVGLVYFALWLIDVIFRALTPAGESPPANVIMILKIVVIAIAILIVFTWIIGVLPPPPGLAAQ